MSDFLDTGAAGLSDAAPEPQDVMATDQPVSSGEQVEDAPVVADDQTTDTVTPELSWEISDDEIDSVLLGKKEIVPETPEPEPTSEKPEDKTEIESAQPKAESEKTDKAEDVEEELKTDPGEKLDWETSPDTFREAHKKLRAEHIALQKESLNRSYLTDVPKFLDTLKEMSTSQHLQLVQAASNEAAAANPQGWVEHFVKTNPDMVAQMLFGDEQITRNKALAMRDLLKESDDLMSEWEGLGDEPGADVQVDEEKAQAIKELAEIRHKEEEARKDSLYSEVVSPIKTVVDRVVRETGFEISPDDSAENKALKQYINDTLPDFILKNLQTDEDINPLFTKATQFIEAGDKQGAMNLQLNLVDFVEGLLERTLGAASHRVAAVEAARETPRVATPPKTVAAAQSTPAPVDPAPRFSDDWAISDGDWRTAVK